MGTASDRRSAKPSETDELGPVLVATGLALVAMILLPAVAQRVGLGSSMTLALRGVFMRASNRM